MPSATPEASQTVAGSLARVLDEIAEQERAHSRAAGSVTLLAVSKTKPASLVRNAAEHGQTAFGENYIEEGIEKIAALSDLSLTWHYIGHIQSNKTKPLATHYDWVQSVDRLKIAKRLAEHRPDDLPPLNICIQLNIDGEETKSGCTPDDLHTLATWIDSAPKLTLRGLMAIPAPRAEFAAQREVFAQLNQIFKQLQADFSNVDTLSMGMSGDMSAAIAEGATMVRIGTAVFGARDKPTQVR